MPNGNDRWAQYAEPSADKWEKYAASGGAFTPALQPTAQQLGADKQPTADQPGAIQRYQEGLRESSGMAPEGGLVSDIKDIGSGFKQIATHPLDSGALLLKGLSDAQQSVIDKAYLEQHGAGAGGDSMWSRARGVVRGAESAIPGAGPILSSAGDKAMSGNYAGMLGTMTPMAAFEGFKASGLANVDMAQMRDLVNKVTDAGRTIERHVAIDKGKASVVNGQVKPALQRYVGAASNEIGQSANSVINQSEGLAQSKGMQPADGVVDISKAAGNARALMEKTGKALPEGGEAQILRAESRPMLSLREAKSFTTDVGAQAAALRQAGKFREAAALDALYDGLHEATQDHADSLGSQYGKLWQHYIDESRTLKTMHEGLMGKVLNEQNPSKALGHLIDPKNAAELSDIKSNMRQYNLDIDQLEKGTEAAVNLDRYTQEAKASFMGKIKAIIKHPVLAGGAALAAAKAGYSSGLPGLGLVLPILVAGKVSNMIDAVQLTELLNEIKKNTPVGSERVLPMSSGPMEKPPTGGAAPPNVPRGTPPAPKGNGGGWKGGINPRGVEASEKPVSLADQIAGLRTQNLRMKEQMRTAGEGVFSEAEIQQAEQRQQENANLIKELMKKQLEEKAKSKPSWKQ